MMDPRLYITAADGTHSEQSWSVTARGVAGAFRYWQSAGKGARARLGVQGHGGDEATIAFHRLARYDGYGIRPSQVWTSHTVDGLIDMSRPEWREPGRG